MESRLLSGHEIEPIEGEEKIELDEDFLAYKNITLNRLIPGNWIIPSPFIPYLDQIYSFKFKPSDVLIITYPKCGTTWTQEIAWTMLNNPNLNHPKTNQGFYSRCPFIELDTFTEMTNLEIKSAENLEIKSAENLAIPYEDVNSIKYSRHVTTEVPPRRTIKTHLPLSMMPSSLLNKCKVIYVARNPKDTCISFLHHSKLMKFHDFVGTQNKFVEYFVNDKVVYSPYATHIKEAWEKKQHKNMHFMFFEDMKSNPKRAIQDLNDFMETKLNEEQISNVVEYTNFFAMKKRGGLICEDDSSHMIESVMKEDGGFFRKGEIGLWKEKLTTEQERTINKWIQEIAPEIPFKYK